jgi:hypothetical protein
MLILAENITMHFRTITLLLALSLCWTGCNDDDEDDNGQGTPSPPTARVERSTYTLNGVQYEANLINIQYSASPQVLEISSVFPNGANAELSMSPIPGEGTYTTSLSINYAIGLSNEAWFCNESCTVVILEHDVNDRWLDATVSGQMGDLFGSSTATLNEARISVFY